MSRLALICGTGALPRAVAGAQDAPPVVAVLEGFAPHGLVPDLTFRLETLGRLFGQLRARDVRAVCLCGAIRRPPVDPARLDAATAPLVPRLTEALGLGDDGALRIILSLFEEQGFQVLAAHEAAPALLPGAGQPTRVQRAPLHGLDAQVGQRTVAAMGRADLGQACVVAGGEAIAREDAAGTDAMLARLARDRRTAGGNDPLTAATDFVGDMLGSASDWLSGRAETGEGGILFKAPKPGQDRRADLPVIGPSTVDGVVSAGLAGIVIEAGGVMVLDLPQVIARCDAAGRFLWVRESQT